MKENTIEKTAYYVMKGDDLFLNGDGNLTTNPMHATPFRTFEKAMDQVNGSERVVRARVSFVIEEAIVA